MIPAAVTPPYTAEDVPAPPDVGLEVRSTVTADHVVEVSLVDGAIGEPAPDEVVVRIERVGPEHVAHLKQRIVGS